MTAPALSVPSPNGRMYRHPSKMSEVPSITNIIGMKDKPALKWWAARQAAEFAANNLDTLKALSVQERIDLIKGAPFRGTKDASNVGSIVHDWIDQWIKGGSSPLALSDSGQTNDAWGDAPWQARAMWAQFGALVRKYRPRFVFSEFTVWSDTHGYAGTADWAARIGSCYVLGDTKTGKGVYPEVGMQLAAIANADTIISPDGVETPIDKFDRFAVLHVRPRSASLIPVTGIDECFKALLGLRAVFDFQVNHSENVLGYAPKISATGGSDD